jgi:hypothetical protein
MNTWISKGVREMRMTEEGKGKVHAMSRMYRCGRVQQDREHEHLIHTTAPAATAVPTTPTQPHRRTQARQGCVPPIKKKHYVSCLLVAFLPLNKIDNCNNTDKYVDETSEEEKDLSVAFNALQVVDFGLVLDLPRCCSRLDSFTLVIK